MPTLADLKRADEAVEVKENTWSRRLPSASKKSSAAHLLDAVMS